MTETRDDDRDLDFARTAPNEGRRCRVCGCTDTNACLVDGQACYWIEPDLCSTHRADSERAAA